VPVSVAIGSAGGGPVSEGLELCICIDALGQVQRPRAPPNTGIQPINPGEQTKQVTGTAACSTLSGSESSWIAMRVTVRRGRGRRHRDGDEVCRNVSRA
jgi:hypothetical protein